MVPQAVDSEALECLKREAMTRAEALGHRLGVFRAAKRDPLCQVAFCGECRHMVIVTLRHRAGERGNAMAGYALETPCPASPRSTP